MDDVSTPSLTVVMNSPCFCVLSWARLAWRSGAHNLRQPPLHNVFP